MGRAPHAWPNLRPTARHSPEGHALRLVPSDHFVHRPREAKAWLDGHPRRFGMVPAPTHGSRCVPDVMKGFFGKMARQALRHIRVGSLGKPGERIEPYLGEADARDPSPTGGGGKSEACG